MRGLTGRLVVAVCAATLSATAFGSRTFLDFPPARIKAIRAPVSPEAGAVVTSVAGAAQAPLIAPYAVIVAVRNASNSRLHVQVDVDGQRVCEADIPAQAVRRLDCPASAPWARDRDHQLRVRGAEPGWSVEYAEVATHFGFTHQIVDAYIVPAGRHVESPGLPAVAALWLMVLLALMAPWQARSGRTTRILFIVIETVAALSLAVVVFAPVATPYRIVISVGSCLLLAAAIVVRPIWTLVTAAWSDARMRRAVRRPRSLQALAALATASVFALSMVYQLTRLHEGNYSGFVSIGHTFFDQHPALAHRDDVRKTLLIGEGGYDGQFAYFETFDPLLRTYRHDPGIYARFIDDPPYRYGRIGLSVLTRLIAQDRWAWYPAVMEWLVIAGVFASAWALARIAIDRGATPFWALLVLLVPGFWQSLRTALPEPLAAAALLAGYWAVTRERWRLATLAFAGALLIRETGVVFVGLVLIGAFLAGHRRNAVAVLVGAALPLAAWRLYVGATFAGQFGWHAFFPAPPDLGVPFAGIVDAWRVIAAGQYISGVEAGAQNYSLVLVAAFALACYFAWKRRSAVSIAALVYGLVAISLNYEQIWVHVGNAQRGTFELFVWLAVCSVTATGTQPGRTGRMVTTAFWIGVAVYVLYGATDADLVRNAIAPF